MTDAIGSSTADHLPPRRRWVFPLRRRTRRMGSVPMGSGERDRRGDRDDDHRRSLIDDLQSSVLIQLGLAMRAYRDGKPFKAIRHLSMASEAVSTLIESMSSDHVEEEDENG